MVPATKQHYKNIPSYSEIWYLPLFENYRYGEILYIGLKFNKIKKYDKKEQQMFELKYMLKVLNLRWTGLFIDQSTV